MHAAAFRKMPTEEVARYLVQRNYAPSTAVIRVLAERGESATPLIKKLLKDEHPWMRRGAAMALVQMHKSASEMTPEIKAMADLVRPLLADSHSEVQAAARAFFGSSQIFESELYEEALKKATSSDLKIRTEALSAALSFQLRPDIAVKISILG